jgi:cell division protein ZapA
MPHVNVTISGRQYRMACEEGEEDHLQALAQDLDGRISEMRSNFGEIGDTRLIVMAAITIADELSDAKRKLEQASQDIAAAQETRATAAERAQATQGAVIAALNAASERIEKVTKSLNHSLGQSRSDTIPMG